jgi:hypothetical protein
MSTDIHTTTMSADDVQGMAYYNAAHALHNTAARDAITTFKRAMRTRPTTNADRAEMARVVNAEVSAAYRSNQCVLDFIAACGAKTAVDIAIVQIFEERRTKLAAATGRILTDRYAAEDAFYQMGAH